MSVFRLILIIARIALLSLLAAQAAEGSASPSPSGRLRAGLISGEAVPGGSPLLAPYPLIETETVRRFVQAFQAPGRRHTIALSLARSGRYLAMIRSVLQRYGLPDELAYVAMVESGFDHTAVSRRGARGLWQFMGPTARRYGLRVDGWVDERMDPEKSTVAAALYLRDLFTQFESWLLAKAAYNAGEFTVIQALQRSQTTDFWILARGPAFREETKRFVPAILAAAVIGKNPERFGFEVVPEPALAYSLIMAPPRLRLDRLAARAGLSVAQLRRLNSELRRGATPPGPPYALKVPPGNEAALEMAITAAWPLLAGRGPE